ncbi:FAD-binding oxidoreductase [Desulfoluna spongiiphila]|uniref:FAD-binding oxidoreductase n=1 Tax=Desulfoluna spongiiphila TaxID=419481 RepID=UPI0012570FA9|nr:FAD-linked oxidase C-terminal domain-containing protein [Desulfoluna spongiiphila]VVS90591.1 fad-linked oxidase c-terminal [Desulfoluna spongiiphila]
MELKRKARLALTDIYGKERLKTSKEDRVCYAYDARNARCIPDAVVFPTSAEEISRTLALACELGFPVVPRGSGTGTTGGSVAVEGGVVLVTTLMDRIVEIDTDNFTAEVEPGVITGDFHKAVEAKGMFYPPDPSSAGISTLGGNVAECAGGPRAVKYGVTRDYVLGVEAVLPTGEIVHTGVRTAKGVVGYDLTRLLVGSEGTLAVITRILLKLLPLPAATATLKVSFASMEEAAEAVTRIIASGTLPRCVEYMDEASIACAQSIADLDLPQGCRSILLIEVDGSASEVATSLEAVAGIVKGAGAMAVEEARDAHEAKRLWTVRKKVSPALYLFGPDKINEDIVVPRSAIPKMVKKIESLKKEYGLPMVSFGHAGDGNIHFNVMIDKKDPVQKLRADAVIDEIFDHTLALGGTLSGEHGVGITKREYIGKEIGDKELEIMRGIKKLFDPKGILNPSKIF